MPHVLDAAGEHDVRGAPGDLAAPAVTAVSAPAHMRSTAKPGNALRQSREQADVRPSVRPWSPTCAVAAMITSPIRSTGISGLRRTSSRTAFTAMSSARVRQKRPLRAGLAERRPDAVDEVDLAHDG
jgi:hypothetical protein